MTKRIIGSVIATLLLSSSLQAHTITPDEIKEFSAQVLHVDFDKAPADVQQNITAEFTQRVKLAEVLVVKLQKDPEFIKLSESLAFDLWSKRIVQGVQPSEDELKKVFNDAKDLKIPLSYKLRVIVVNQESMADDLINQLKAQSGDERNQLFTSLAAKHSLDPSSKQQGGNVGWMDALSMPESVSSVLKDKETNTIVKISSENGLWNVLSIDEIKPEHAATFEEAKNHLLTMMRQQKLNSEVKMIMERSDTKGAKKSQHK